MTAPGVSRLNPVGRDGLAPLQAVRALLRELNRVVPRDSTPLAVWLGAFICSWRGWAPARPVFSCP